MGPLLWQWNSQHCPRLRLGGAEHKAHSHGSATEAISCGLPPRVLVRARVLALHLAIRPNLHCRAKQGLGVQGTHRYPTSWVFLMPALWFRAPFCYSAPICPSAAPPGTRVSGPPGLWEPCHWDSYPQIAAPGIHHSKTVCIGL